MPIPDAKQTIVFDVDETVLTTVNRDYENSQPIMPVVEGMRALKAAGWYIILFTARGQGRSDGNIEAVREEVTREITSCCEKFDIPYDQLLLGKPFAAYYCDDKALRPEEFAAKYKDILSKQQ